VGDAAVRRDPRVNRLFVADADQGGFDAFLLAPVERTAMLVAKVLTLLCYLLALELIAVPAFALLLLGPSAAHGLGELIVTLLLGDIGVAVIGTLVAALAVRTRARDLLGPLLALPLFVPIVIGGARASAPLLASVHPAPRPRAGWRRWASMIWSSADRVRPVRLPPGGLNCKPHAACACSASRPSW